MSAVVFTKVCNNITPILVIHMHLQFDIEIIVSNNYKK